jgi:hypothetical protein
MLSVSVWMKIRDSVALSLYNERSGFATNPAGISTGVFAMSEQPSSSPAGQWLTILLTLMFAGGILLFLVLVSGGFFAYVLLAVFGIGAVGFLHYALWGQALTEEVAGERAAAEAKARLEADNVLPPTSSEQRHGIRRI